MSGARKNVGMTHHRLALHLIFHLFSPLTCCLDVVLQLDKGDYPENSHAVFSPNKQRSSEPFLCLDLASEHKRSDFCPLTRFVLRGLQLLREQLPFNLSVIVLLRQPAVARKHPGGTQRRAVDHNIV